MKEPAVLYRTIHKLPLSRFIEAAVDNDLNALVISGTADQAELLTAWDDLQQQYSDAIGGSDKEYSLGLIVSITRNKVKIHLVDAAVRILRQVYAEKLEQELINVNMIPRGKRLDVNKPDEYDKILDSCLSRVKRLILNVNRDEKELEKIQGAVKDTGKLSRKHFSDILISLSDHCGFEIREEEITVYKFCERINRMIGQYEEMKNKKIKSVT